MLMSDTSAGKLPEMDVKLSARVVECRSRQVWWPPCTFSATSGSKTMALVL